MNDYIKLCKNQTVKEFTFTLKELEKTHGYFPKFNKKQAKEIFVDCVDIAITIKDNNIRYNALRLAKFAVYNDEFLKDHHKHVWELYKYILFDDNGNIRNAGINLLSRFNFALICLIDPCLVAIGKRKKISNNELLNLEKFFIDCYIELETFEAIYVKEKKNKLSKKDIGDGLTIPFAVGTKDKILKSIRRGIEEFRRGVFFEELLNKYGYDQIKHNVWQDPTPHHSGCSIRNKTKKNKEKSTDINVEGILKAMMNERNQ